MRAGAQAATAFFHKPVDARSKGMAAHPVSEADLASEQAMLRLLEARAPADPVLSEEAGAGASRAARRWVLDPLDGTVSFLAGLPTWSVAVALLEDGLPQASAVFDPTGPDVYVAEAGRGAWCNGEPLSLTDRQERGRLRKRAGTLVEEGPDLAGRYQRGARLTAGDWTGGWSGIRLAQPRTGTGIPVPCWLKKRVRW